MAPMLTIAVGQYEIEPFKYPRLHWLLIVFAEGKRGAHRYHIVGNTDTFTFEHNSVNDLLHSSKLMGGVNVGEIAADKLAWLDATLRTVPIIKNDPNFHCQTWTVEAIRKMAEYPGQVKILPGVTKAWLMKEMERQWDLCEEINPHYFEVAMG